MGKRKKSSNELDAILEQLKRSYGADIDAELEDSLLDDEKSNEDDELSSVLAKIFSDFEQEADRAVSETAVQSEYAEIPTETVIENTSSGADDTEPSVDLTEEQVRVEQESQVKSVQAQESDNAQESPLPTKEQQEVDDVLSAMLHRSVLAEQAPEAVENDEIADYTSDPRTEDMPRIEETLTEADDNGNASDVEQDIPASDVKDTAEETESIINSELLPDEIPSEDQAIEVEIIEDDIIADNEIEDDIIADQIIEDEPVDTDTLPQRVPAVLVLDPVLYTDDPLQLSLFDLDLIKTEDDIEETKTDVTNEEPIITPTENTNLDSNDVSLLVKFGYGEEVNAQIGRDKVKKVIFDKGSNYAPERHKVPFGFIGKEYSDRSQDDAIRQKYKNDRFALLVSLIAICSLTLVSFVLGLIFEFAPNRLDYYVAIMSLDFLFVAIAALVCGKRLVFGAIGISKFESNPNSVLLILSSEYLTYNVLVSAIYAIEPILLYNSFCWISGSCVLAYFAVGTLCDLIRCDKEYRSFELMTSQDAFYTAEKISASDETGDIARNKRHVNAAPGTYRVRKTPMIGGYFKKISESGFTSISPVYALGVVPSISLALGCLVAIVSESVLFGIHTFTITSMLCIPISCLCLGAISGVINAKHYRENNAAFIGENNEEYSSVVTLVFDDTDAVEITSYKEINPGKNAGDASEKLIIAYNVFKMLRGPLGEAVPDKYISNDIHELIINSISDNGINIYFDSSTNILIGDKQYMLEHNLKVKTDVNLTTATKGADRYVVYMAFDGKPQLGFVLTQRIKPDFSKAVAILASAGIAMAIEGYEPEVNDVFFEQNKASDYSVISVHKIQKFQRKTDNAACDGTLIAKDALSLSKAISKSKNEPARKQRIKRANLLSFIMGGSLSVLIAVIMCSESSIGFLETLREYPYIAFAVAIVISAIPAIINTVKEYLRK